jgi:hypothetical protein
MTRTAYRRLWLLLGVAVLLALALWQWQRDRAAAPGSLLGIDPATITRVELQLGRAAPMHFARRDNHWWRTDGGSPARVNDARLDALTAIAAAPVEHWRAATDLDPAKVGLAAPRAVLTLDGHALHFGAVAAIGHRCYVQRGARVALVSLRYMPQAPRDEKLALH